jgi:hypothetical protein
MISTYQRLCSDSSPAQQGILTPASLVDKVSNKGKSSEPYNSIPAVPKALGQYQDIDSEEVERERGNLEFKNGNFSAAIKSYTKCLGLKVIYVDPLDKLHCMLISSHLIQ